jgi:Chaperone for flagella basal body P-ring formation
MTMRSLRLSPILACTLLLSGLALAASGAALPAQQEAHRAEALWLSRQLHQPVEAAQLLVSPRLATLEGCAIADIRPAPTGATALSLRCPGHVLPQLMLVNLAFDAVADALPGGGSGGSAHPSAALRSHALRAPRALPLIRAGATVEADWRTPVMHAQLPVVAMDSGAAGARIRVRIANTNHILRARILTARSVAIVAPGA